MAELSLAYPSLVGPLSESRLARFEARTGRRLPDAYREFLLAYNGGVPKRRGLKFFHGIEEQESQTLLECFYGLHDEPIPDKAQWRLHESIEAVWNMVQKDRPGTTLVPIAREVSGSLICIETDGPDRGRILFWDHDYDAAYPLAESLQQLHGSLFGPDDRDGLLGDAPAAWVPKRPAG